MRSKTVLMAGVLAVFVAGMAAAAATTAAYSFDGSESADASVPRYSETCAHGHNGFDCKPPNHAADIASLEQRVTQLEQDVQSLGRR